MLQTVNNYREILLSGAPLMDTRAPIEFSRGSFPGATNLPLMTDDERAQVGTCYKEKGQAAAIALGHQLVAGEVRSQRIDAWAAFARANPEGYLFCFRGGLRSQIVQRWLAETAGVEYRRIEGGYKVMRQFLMTTTETAVNERKMLVVGGMTGTGKTELLAKLPYALDLEGCANHRGSGFGKRVNGQPAQIDFEHQIAIRFLQLEAAGLLGFVVEDEGHFVGKCALPERLYREMNQAPLVWLEDTFENRVIRILNDYVVDQLADHQAFYGADEGFSQFEAHLQQSLANIQKRLGGERYKRASAMMADALSTQRLSGTVEGHRVWIELLLREYYDPMYTHQRASKAGRIIAAGGADKLQDFLLK